MSNQARQLIENISDQYVLLAADPAQAFTAVAQKKKKNRTKIFAIAAAAAAMYIIITVSLIIGALTPPDDPVAPPDDGPGAQDRPEQPGEPDAGPEDPNPPDEPGTSPNIYKPTSDQIYESLCASWIYGSDKQPQYRPTYFAFTQAQKFYMVNAETGESVQGTYRMEDNNQNEGKITFSLWVLNEEQEWEKYPVTVQLLFNGANYNGHLLLVTYEDRQETITYWRRSLGIENFIIWSGYSGKSHSVNAYIEKIEVSESQGYEHNEFNFSIPDNSIFNTMSPIRLDGNTVYRIKPGSYFQGSAVSYTIYRADGSIYLEGKLSYQSNGFTENYIPTIPDGQTYFYHLRYTCDQNSTRLTATCHAYFAILQNKSTISPILPQEPEIKLPDLNYFWQHLRGKWYPKNNALPFWFAFQPDGRVYVMNTNTNESSIKSYSLNDNCIDIFSYHENIGWQRENIDIQLDTENDCLNVTFGEESRQYYRDSSSYYPVRIFNSNTQTKEDEKIYNFYFEEIRVSHSNSVFRFDLPDFEHFKQLTPLSFTDIPRFSISRIDCTASYKVYTQDGILFSESSWNPSAGRDAIDIPDKYGIYYIDITYSLDVTSFPAYVQSQQIVHYYIAIDYHEKDQPDYVPPVLGDNRISIPLLDCDSPLAHMTLDTQNALHGSGCASITFSKGSPVLSPNKFQSPIDATGMDMLEFDLYVSDLSLLTGNFFPSTTAALEITSGGTCDYEELLFTWEDIVRYGLAGQELKQGWNHVIFPLNMAKENSASAKEFDISQIDFIRFYIIDTSKLGSGEYTVKLDNICLTGEQK